MQDRADSQASLKRVLHRLEFSAGKLHRRVAKFKLESGVQVVDTDAIGRGWPNCGNRNGSLVLVPLVRSSLRRGILLIHALIGGLLRDLVRVLNRWLLLNGRGIVQGICGRMGCMSVETLRHFWTLSRSRRESRAACGRSSHALSVVRCFSSSLLHLTSRNLEGRTHVCVRGSNSRVFLLYNIEGLVRDGLRALKHTRMRLDCVVADITSDAMPLL